MKKQLSMSIITLNGYELGQLSSSFDHAYEGRCWNDLHSNGSPSLLFC